MALTADNQYAEAMDVWNEANTNPTIALHEIEILARDCHHDQDTSAREDEYYAVDPAFDGIEGVVTLLDDHFAALEYAAGFLRAWTSRNPLHSYKCDEPTRRQVRKLLRKNKIADAIDAWMADKPNPTIAIHKIRVIKKGCHHDEPGNNSPSQHARLLLKRRNRDSGPSSSPPTNWIIARRSRFQTSATLSPMAGSEPTPLGSWTRRATATNGNRP